MRRLVTRYDLRQVHDIGMRSALLPLLIVLLTVCHASAQAAAATAAPAARADIEWQQQLSAIRREALAPQQLTPARVSSSFGVVLSPQCHTQDDPRGTLHWCWYRPPPQTGALKLLTYSVVNFSATVQRGGSLHWQADPAVACISFKQLAALFGVAPSRARSMPAIDIFPGATLSPAQARATVANYADFILQKRTDEDVYVAAIRRDGCLADLYLQKAAPL